MYADRVEAESKRSIKDRLNGTSIADTRRQQFTGKRQRQDDKWEHDLYNEDEPQILNNKVGARDLRLKLQKKSLGQASQRGSLSGVRDLRDKLTGLNDTQPMNVDPPKRKLEAPRPTRKSVAEVPTPELKKGTNPAPRKKAGTSVDDFLNSLGLEKYLITFQAEEVDMTALVHMTDDDLKALGIPMVLGFSLTPHGSGLLSCSLTETRFDVRFFSFSELIWVDHYLSYVTSCVPMEA